MLELTLLIILPISVGLLIASLHPIRIICEDQGSLGQEYAWKGLGFLIILFILGYSIYFYTLLQSGIQSIDVVIIVILFSGSCFVLAVIKLSLQSIKEIKKVSLLERHHALHDALTNLPNRVLLNEAMSAAIATSKRNSTPLVIMLMDLNNFKEVNDTLGHYYGDRLLQSIVPVLKKSIREIDMIARLGGDEFAVILPSANLDDAKLIATRIINAMEQPFSVDQHLLHIGISIGISQHPEDGVDGDSLLQKADVAMYIAKRNSLGFSVYDLSRDKNSLTRLVVLGKLRNAVANNQLTPYYQPIINLKTGEIHALEVLTRWHDEELGHITPDEFIPIAEKSGLIKQLSAWVLDASISQFVQWQTLNMDFILSVNLSARDMQDETMINELGMFLSKHGMHPSQLNIEITESSMMLESNQPHHLISKLNQLGVSVSIDDFGTGFSSLAYLKKLSTQSIKIDKSFVIDMLDDQSDEVIVRSILDIAHNLGQVVVAEGIETKKCLDRLKDLNCSYGQGYFICKPLPAEQIFIWLQKNSKAETNATREYSVAHLD